MESFVNARSSTQRQHKMDSLQGIFSQLALSYLQSDFVLSVLITEKKRHIFPLSFLQCYDDIFMTLKLGSRSLNFGTVHSCMHAQTRR
jgi:hypothetical protein